MSVPIAPVLRLCEKEVKRVRRFAENHNLGNRSHVVLFECSPKSGQSFVTPTFALKVADLVAREDKSIAFVLSSDIPSPHAGRHIIDGSSLTYRENAELTRYCSLLVGCSSGITWLCTSDWAKPLPTIQLLRRDSLFPNSVIDDHRRFGLSTSHIVELEDCTEETAAECILITLKSGVSAVRSRRRRSIRPKTRTFRWLLEDLLTRADFGGATQLLISFIRSNSFSIDILLAFIFAVINTVFNRVRGLHDGLYAKLCGRSKICSGP